MSSKVTTITPFIDKEILIKSLEKLGCKCTLQGNEIITDRKDYYGFQKFVFNSDRFIFVHDSDERSLNNFRNIDNKEYKSTQAFLSAVEKEYTSLYKQKLEELERLRMEEEKRRLEEERKAFIEKQKQEIMKKAKEKGYYIKEEKVANKIKLVLTKVTY